MTNFTNIEHILIQTFLPLLNLSSKLLWDIKIWLEGSKIGLSSTFACLLFS